MGHFDQHTAAVCIQFYKKCKNKCIQMCISWIPDTKQITLHWKVKKDKSYINKANHYEYKLDGLFVAAISAILYHHVTMSLLFSSCHFFVVFVIHYEMKIRRHVGSFFCKYVKSMRSIEKYILRPYSQYFPHRIYIQRLYLLIDYKHTYNKSSTVIIITS